jgi:ABC-type polysaccharide/polyol phosphate transport system ATPase subunit
VSAFCSRAVWVEDGSTRMEGNAGTVVEAYRAGARQGTP